MSCAWLLRHVTVTTLLCVTSYLHLCECISIDHIISNSMTSPSGYGFMYDEASSIVRVDMDMIFSVQDWNMITSLNNSYHGSYKRQAIKSSTGEKYWPGGVIYYEIDQYDFRGSGSQMLHAAMNDWMRYTCVQFRPAYPDTQNKIRFVDGDGCSSNVGMIGGTQKVTLANGCRVKGVVTHELGHVLGFHHEQTRPDRDYYVKIHPENIPDHLEFNFRKYTWAVIQNLGVPYDYNSIMHYGRDAFSYNGRDTIETIDSRYQDVIGNRQALSFRDIKSVNILYNCRAATSNCRLQDQDCPGEGFVSKDCTCWCPSQDHNNDQPYYVCQPGSNPDNNGPYPNNGGSYPGNGGSYPGNGNQGGGSGCNDQHGSCSMWASRGECRNNPAYMEYYCRRACGLCNTVTPSCRDAYAACGYWVQKGFCRVGSPFSVVIATSCRQSCGFCQTNGGSYYALSPMNPESDDVGLGSDVDRWCSDVEPKEACAKWKDDGECHLSRDVMAGRCQRTCGMCDSRNNRIDTPEPGKRKILPCERKCRNEHARCEEWASRGECSATPDYMLRRCRKACDTCCTAGKYRTATESPPQRKDRRLKKSFMPDCIERSSKDIQM